MKSSKPVSGKRKADDLEEDDRAAALAALNANGLAFLSSFQAYSQKTEPKRIQSHHRDSSEDLDSEWTGVLDEGDDSQNEDDEPFEPDPLDTPMEPDQSVVAQPQVVVFADAMTSRSRPAISGLAAKTFMSSKVNKIHRTVIGGTSGKGDNDDDSDDDRSHIKNDRELHKMLHTQLLSSSTQTETDLTPARRRKALQGRMLEIADGAKIGKGELKVRKLERNKAAKHVRDGMEAKQERRKAQQLEQAKNLGNYHPTLKRLFGAEDEPTSMPKRKRGLAMGVGKFAGGKLVLGKSELAKVNGGPVGGERSRPRGRGGRKGGQSRRS